MNWPAIWMSSSVHSLWHIMLKIFGASNSAFTCFTWASHPAVLHFMNMSNNARFLLTIKFGPFFTRLLFGFKNLENFSPNSSSTSGRRLYVETFQIMPSVFHGWRRICWVEFFFSHSELPYCEGWTSPSSDVFFHFTRRNAVQSRHKEEKAQKKSWECHSEKMDFFFSVLLFPSACCPLANPWKLASQKQTLGCRCVSSSSVGFSLYLFYPQSAAASAACLDINIVCVTELGDSSGNGNGMNFKNFLLSVFLQQFRLAAAEWRL